MFDNISSSNGGPITRTCTAELPPCVVLRVLDALVLGMTEEEHPLEEVRIGVQCAARTEAQNEIQAEAQDEIHSEAQNETQAEAEAGNRYEERKTTGYQSHLGRVLELAQIDQWLS
jgi:hypothetical protein